MRWRDRPPNLADWQATADIGRPAEIDFKNILLAAGREGRNNQLRKISAVQSLFLARKINRVHNRVQLFLLALPQVRQF